MIPAIYHELLLGNEIGVEKTKVLTDALKMNNTLTWLSLFDKITTIIFYFSFIMQNILLLLHIVKLEMKVQK